MHLYRLANGTYALTATATDIAGNTSALSAAYTIKIDTIAPTAVGLSNSSVAENQPVGMLVGAFTTTDLTLGDNHVYSLVAGSGSTDNASFTINGNQLLTAACSIMRAKASYSIRVRTTDAGRLILRANLHHYSHRSQRGPHRHPTVQHQRPENQPVGTNVGTFSTYRSRRRTTPSPTAWSRAPAARTTARSPSAATPSRQPPRSTTRLKNSYSIRVRTHRCRRAVV